MKIDFSLDIGTTVGNRLYRRHEQGFITAGTIKAIEQLEKELEIKYKSRPQFPESRRCGSLMYERRDDKESMKFLDHYFSQLFLAPLMGRS